MMQSESESESELELESKVEAEVELEELELQDAAVDGAWSRSANKRHLYSGPCCSFSAGKHFATNDICMAHCVANLALKSTDGLMKRKHTLKKEGAVGALPP